RIGRASFSKWLETLKVSFVIETAFGQSFSENFPSGLWEKPLGSEFLGLEMRMETIRLSMAQAIIKFLKAQHIERDGREAQFFAGCFGIFGHGNVAGIGQALQQNPDFRYHQT